MPALLGVFRDRGRIRGVIGAVCHRPGSRRSPRPRRSAMILDVRLQGHGYGPSWHFAEPSPDAFREFERAAARHLGWGLAGLAYRSVPAADLPLLARRGAVVREAAASAEMTLDWDSRDGWLRTLGKSRRTDLRRCGRRLDENPDLAITFASGRTDLDPHRMAEIAGEHRAGLQRRLDRRPPLPPGHFAELLSRPDVSVLSYTSAQRGLLGFGFFLDAPVRPLIGWWASVRPENGARNLYFDSYFRYMEHAVTTGATVLSAGQGALEHKLGLGFQAWPLKLVLVPRWAMG